MANSALRFSWAVAITCALCACGSNTKKKEGLPVGGPNTLATGYCADSCVKACDQDEDCHTTDGELCCDFGSDGKACTSARECPRVCDSDVRCDARTGEGCERVTLDAKTKVCANDAQGLQLCPNGNECTRPGEACCSAYREAVCLPTNNCPTSCDSDGACATVLGETCCKTLSLADKTLKSGGLCVNESSFACPAACKQSSECNQKAGELCCDGVCSQDCPRACTASSDCSGQVCCKTKATRSPLFPGRIRVPGYASSVPPGRTCGGYQCLDGTCLASSARCDGRVECKGGEDESGCNNCVGGFRCASGGCLGLEGRCNGVQECPSGDDESGCPFTCATGFMCPGFSSCIDSSLRCDGARNCPGGEDELGCGTCPGFLCASGMCLAGVFQCDGHADCPNADDEAQCSACPGYQCINGPCLLASVKCDGVRNCFNGDDELGCAMSCPGFTCKGGRCIPQAFVCDGFSDCPDADDEMSCSDAGQ